MSQHYINGAILLHISKFVFWNILNVQLSRPASKSLVRRWDSRTLSRAFPSGRRSSEPPQRKLRSLGGLNFEAAHLCSCPCRTAGERNLLHTFWKSMNILAARGWKWVAICIRFYCLLQSFCIFPHVSQYCHGWTCSCSFTNSSKFSHIRAPSLLVSSHSRSGVLRFTTPSKYRTSRRMSPYIARRCPAACEEFLPVEKSARNVFFESCFWRTVFEFLNGSSRVASTQIAKIKQIFLRCSREAAFYIWQDATFVSWHSWIVIRYLLHFGLWFCVRCYLNNI